MDRREALQKMMAGGALVVGASMVSSSPVFANAGSVGAGEPMGAGLTTPPPYTQTVNDKRNATWTVTAPDVHCSSGDMRVSSSGFARTLSGNVSAMLVSPNGFGYQPGSTATFTAIGTGPGNSPFRQGDSFEVIWSVRYECALGNQVVGCRIVDYTYRYVNTANGNPDWQQVPMVPLQHDCSP